MSDDEKKFRLDELPDEGSVPEPPPASRIKTPKQSVDPRLEKLNQLDAESKVDTMVRKWTFDQPVYHYTWVAFVGVIIVFQVTSLNASYLEIYRLVLLLGGVFPEVLIVLKPLLKHPVGWLLLLPLFKFKEKSEYAFTVTFDGVQTVRKFVPIGKKDIVTQVSLRWSEIGNVKKRQEGNKEILGLYAGGEHIADIIWYISEHKKKALKLLLKEMVPKEHPLRIFLENEKELK